MAIISRDAVQLKETLTGLRDEVYRLDGTVERLQESALERQPGYGLAALKAEDVGWKLIAGGETIDEEIDLATIKMHSDAARALQAANPLVKRGINVRTSYIFEDKIDYPKGAKRLLDNDINKVNWSSDTAEEELEAALNTDGNYFLLLDPARKEARRIPFREITGVVTNPEFDDDIWYYKRSYTISVTDSSGNTKTTPKEVYIPAITFKGEPKKRIGEVQVDWKKRMEHVAVNRQTGWRFGLPDLMGAVYWARSYKEYLEAQHTLAKALARIAFKVTSQSGKGQKSAAAKVARPTNVGEAGGVATLGLGQDLVALNKSGAGVDLKGGTPLAAMVAASLDIPLSVLLTDGSAGGRQGAESALEGPTVKTMNKRRKLHLASRARILKLFGIKDEPTWTNIDDEPIHRKMQAVTLGQNTGTLHPDEIRAATVRALRLVTDRADDDIPEGFFQKNEPQDDGAGDADGRENPGGTGPMSDGTNDSRDNPGGPTDA